MSTTGKGILSIRKKDVAEQKDIAIGFKKLVFAHKAVAGELTIDLTALVTPTEMSVLGFTNPSAADLATAQLKLYQDNLTLTSTTRPSLIKDLSYTVRSNTSIVFNGFEALEDEIFVGHVDQGAKTDVAFVDARPINAAGTLIAGATDINVGDPFEAGKYPSAQSGAVLVFVDGLLQARNTGNQAAPADGNYYEVDAGGLSSLIRMNSTSLVDRDYIVVGNGMLVEKPNGSQLAEIEKAQGQIDAMIPTLALAAGVPETNFQAAPNNQDLKQFGDRMVQAEADIDVLEAGVNKFQTKILTSDVTTNITVGDLTFNSLVIGKTYEIKLQASCLGTAVSADVVLTTVHDSVNMMVNRFNLADTVGWTGIVANSTIFVATATTLTFVTTLLGGGDTLQGNSTRDETFAQLIERNDLNITGDFT